MLPPQGKEEKAEQDKGAEKKEQAVDREKTDPTEKMKLAEGAEKMELVEDTEKKNTTEKMELVEDTEKLAEDNRPEQNK